MPLPADKSRVIRFGLFEVDLREAELRRGGIRLKLQEQPFQVLTTLLERPGQTVTREELRQKLWPADTFVDFDHSLNSSINKLREALGDKADTPRYIETLPKRGYRFIGEVVGQEPKLDTETAAGILPIGPLEPAAANSVRPQKWVIVSSILALLVSAIGVAAYFVLKPEPEPRIVGAHILTKTGNGKGMANKPLADRHFLYFDEAGDTGTLQVPTAGGEVSEALPVSNYFSRSGSGWLRPMPMDISRDGSELLLAQCQPRGPRNNNCDIWAQPLPSGTPRLIVQDGIWPLWGIDGQGIFFVRGGKGNGSELYHANVDGTGVKRLAVVPEMGFLHLSPDGSRIRFTGDFPAFQLWEVGADGSNPHPILTGYQDVFGGSWSSDGKYYFFTAWDGDRSSLWAVSEARPWWRKTNTSIPQRLTFGPLSIGTPEISKDGKQLYAVGVERRGELSVYDSKSGKFVPYLGGESICMVDFSRDRQWIAYVTYPEGTLWRSRIDGSERRQLTVPPIAAVNPRWSPDGKLIAFMDGSNGNRRTMTYFGPQRMYAVSADGGGPILLLAGTFGDPTWSPDGKLIAYQYFPYPASEVRILDLKDQRSITVPGSQGSWSPRWSPDGKYLVTLGGDRSDGLAKKLMLFSFATHAWVELASASAIFGWPSWSHDNKFVYAVDGESVVRIAVADHKKEQVASLRGFRATTYYFDRDAGFWLGFTPDDRPLTLRDTGIQEIYAFDLEYK